MSVLASGMVLAGCGGGGGGSSDPPPAKPPTTQAGSVAVNVLGATGSSASGKVTATDPQGLALTYTVISPPAVGTVTVDAKTGNFTYSLAGDTTSSQDSFTVSVSNGQAAAATAVVTVQLKGDPLLVNQWHIRNTGASAFSTVPPVAGNDMNVAGAWAAGYSGKGIKVGVVDTGLEAAHEDLAANVDVGSSYNFLTGGNDPTRAADDVGDDHGTQVAGIIGAVAFNGKGGRGVAYNARLRGYNLTAPSADTLINYDKSMGGLTASASNDIFNTSFLRAAATLPPASLADDDIDKRLAALRGALGAVHVRSAGNTFTTFDPLDPDLTQRCAASRAGRVSCGNPAQDQRMSLPGPIVVGALDADGKRSSYSTTGSSLWVSAPGGEFGFDSAYYTSSRLGPDDTKPAIVTTARSGCANRPYADGIANALATGTNPLARNCQYTAQMNGTSSASPNVSGVVALMLEANPKLSARDVKFILAKTARPVDPGLAAVTASGIVQGRTLTLEQGWVKNAAGFQFSNAYGFGAVDAAAAVTMAKAYSNPLPTPKSLVGSVKGNYTVGADGFSYTSTITANLQTIEQVVLTANFTTQALLCNQIEVTSPAGTRSILLHAFTGYTQAALGGARILSNAFYGETATGRWTITYFNFCSGPTTWVADQEQRITFHGH